MDGEGLEQAPSSAGSRLHSQDGPRVSVEWFDGLVERIELLRKLPDQGRTVPEWGEQAVRDILYDPYRVIYEVFPDHVEMLTLRHYCERHMGNPGTLCDNA